jgi:hypothetical protein
METDSAVFRRKPEPPPPPRFSLSQVMEMIIGTLGGALILYIANTVTSLPGQMQQVLNNQTRFEKSIEIIAKDQRDMDRRLTKVENE